nr:PREDICTED: carcinoembryonic antigen-related cell adhesion molecule 6-like [Latimeria chalumnae]|eukprot:XP_014345778.1 PREDICTED: carcinoembryonic antigen-related cell adhesion molecule 6-like [Latimeria chalumnae]
MSVWAMVLLTCSVRLAVRGENFVLTVPENLVISSPGQTVYLLIKPSIAGDYTVTWLFNSQALPIANNFGTNITYNETYKGRIKLYLNNATLRLENVTLGDSGVYIVDITLFRPLSTASAEVRLEVYTTLSKPIITVTSSPTIEGDNVTMTCSYDEGIDPTFSWHRGSQLIDCSNQRYQCQSTSSSLTITSVRPSEGGFYSCSVENPVSSETSDPKELLVYYGPNTPNVTINAELCGGEELSSSYCVEVGSPIKLNCEADSFPKSNYTWWANSSDVVSYNNFVHIMKSEFTDAGIYICIASNNYTTITRSSPSLSLLVYRRPQGQPRLNCTEVSSDLQVSCSWYGGIPPAQIELEVHSKSTNGTEEAAITFEKRNTVAICKACQLNVIIERVLPIEQPYSDDKSPATQGVKENRDVILFINLTPSPKTTNRKSSRVELLPATFTWYKKHHDMILEVTPSNQTNFMPEAVSKTSKSYPYFSNTEYWTGFIWLFRVFQVPTAGVFQGLLCTLM